MTPKVLISDSLSSRAVEIFKERGIEVDIKTGLTPAELTGLIGGYDGLAIRSATKVTPEVLAAATRLKVVGRAGIGVDNVDVAAATAQGVVVMNTPYGNATTTAEHAIAMMFALARQIPAANASTQAGKWEKSRFMGMELAGKTLGIIGCGNIGSIVADRARGLKMKVIAYDPFLSPDRAEALGVERVALEALFPRADIITLHTPLIDATRGIVNAASLAACKRGVYIINCARGGLVVEADLATALDSGHVAGAGMDVFVEEPAKQNVLFGRDNVVCTPHLGAATVEAQETVALQVAEQISDFLLNGAIVNAVNTPSVSAEDAPRLRPYTRLAALLGSFAGQVVESPIRAATLTYEGAAAGLKTLAPLQQAALTGLLRPMLETVNPVNAVLVAKERGIAVAETRNDIVGDYHTCVRLKLDMEGASLTLAGSLFGGQPRLVAIDDVLLEAELTPHMLFVRNRDRPGFIGRLGTTLGEAGVNIANFTLGRRAPGQDAVALVAIDGSVSPALLARIRALDGVIGVTSLTFAEAF